ncbi:hypothetical protein SAMN05421755_1001104 [Nitrosomonas sp. Nm33]|nr:hypothetical protein SAMN05421755_1001104 [Nitrosomonas sp. Nm33]
MSRTKRGLEWSGSEFHIEDQRTSHILVDACDPHVTEPYNELPGIVPFCFQE